MYSQSSSKRLSRLEAWISRLDGQIIGTSMARPIALCLLVVAACIHALSTRLSTFFCSTRWRSSAPRFLGGKAYQARDSNLAATIGKVPCRSQCSSRLMNLPPELRMLIYEFALAQYQDQTMPCLDGVQYHDRPGITCQRRMHLELLSTCRQVYKEAWDIPLRLAEYSFRNSLNDACLDSRKRSTWRGFSPRQRTLIRNVNLRVPDGWPELSTLSQSLPLACDRESYRPEKLTITVKMSDWWNWKLEKARPIENDKQSMSHLPESLTELVIEFETTKRQKPQLDEILSKAAESWKVSRLDGVDMVPVTPLSELRWQVPACVSLGGGGGHLDPMELVDHYWMTLTWKIAR